MLRVCIAGATGWTGEALVRGVREAADLELRSAVSRSAAGGEIDGAPVYASAAEALDGRRRAHRLHVGRGGEGQRARRDRGAASRS